MLKDNKNNLNVGLFFFFLVQFQPAVPPHVRLLRGAAQDAEAGHQWGQRGLRHALTPPVAGTVGAVLQHTGREMSIVGSGAAISYIHLHPAAVRLCKESLRLRIDSLSGRETAMLAQGPERLSWNRDSMVWSPMLLYLYRISRFCKKINK